MKITEIEAINAIKCNKPTSGYIILCEALDMAVDALEKQMPKRPLFRKEDKRVFADCPNCNETLTYEDKIKANFYKFNYCFYCGQKLDWSDHPTEKGGDG